MQANNHFDLTQWTDYVREVTVPSSMEDMGHHLKECLLCSLTVDLLRRAAATARIDRSFEPPASVVEAALRIFPATTGVEWKVWTGLRRVVAEMTVNAALAPAIQGVRSLRSASRHFAYKAGQYSVDLQVDKDPGVTAVGMTGQVADETAPDIPVGNTRVVLLSGNRLLATTGTNEFGEFFLQYEPSGNLHLLLPIEEAGEYIELQLDLPLEID